MAQESPSWSTLETLDNTFVHCLELDYSPLAAFASYSCSLTNCESWYSFHDQRWPFSGRGLAWLRLVGRSTGNQCTGNSAVRSGLFCYFRHHFHLVIELFVRAQDILPLVFILSGVLSTVETSGVLEYLKLLRSKLKLIIIWLSK